MTGPLILVGAMVAASLTVLITVIRLSNAIGDTNLEFDLEEGYEA